MENISQDAVVIVPTRGLQHSLLKQYDQLQINAGFSAWKSPHIIVWEDYIEQLWRANKQLFSTAYIRLNNAQALLVWQQVINRAKKDDLELLLLNEQQTAAVAQRSWKLAHKWQIPLEKLQQRHDLDSTAFVSWCETYQQRLKANNWLDPSQLETLLIEKIESLQGLSTSLVFAYFDLMTSSQRAYINGCEARNILVSNYSVADARVTKSPQIQYNCYSQEQHEVQSVMLRARELIEQNSDNRIGIVIPNLSENRAQIEQIAQSVFYPKLSPLECQQTDLVFRFSLGQPLNSIAYVHSMLNALELLKNSFSYQNVQTFFSSQWWPLKLQSPADLIRLDRAIKKRRSPWLSWQDIQVISQEQLPDADSVHNFFQRVIEFKASIDIPEKNLRSMHEWQTLFSQWLVLLGWSENDLDSWHYQAHESWLETMQIFVSHDLVQGKIGLSRALQTLNSLCKDKVYMRQAKNEPILLSGVLEGIGQTVDYLFVTGMHEAYPSPMQKDPFISNSLLVEQGYPFANNNTEFVYEQNKLASLLAGGQTIEVSYASQCHEGEYAATALLRSQTFTQIPSRVTHTPVSQLVEYRDTSGLACLQSANIQGGSKVFENQSHCPFKAYVEHRLLRQNDDEPEFGLDARDAGTLVHDVLENVWHELQSFSTLSRLGEIELATLIERHVDSYIDAPNTKFQFDRGRLLSLEKPRLKKLLMEWLLLEQEQRITPYAVMGIEKRIQSEFGGIPINLVIDRIDCTDQGDCLIIDYKTGQANISDWNSERPKSPQMPLYALALEQHSDYTIKGIGFGKLKSNDCELIGISELDNVGANFRAHLSTRDKKTWSEQLQEWHVNLTQIAQEFLDGHAVVNPSKVNPCQYCDLHSMCRIHQLKSQSGQSLEQHLPSKGMES